MTDAAINDCLLELKGEGECRHKWKGQGYHLARGEYKICALCEKEAHGGPYPAVGDGHIMSAVEMVQLCRKLWVYSLVEIHNFEEADNYSVRLLIPGTADSCVYDEYWGHGETLEIALGLAVIIAAKKKLPEGEVNCELGV